MKGETIIPKMEELYEKVVGDSALQEKLVQIMKDAETAGKEESEAKLIAFAKEAGFDVTMKEMQEFFKGLVETNEGTLSDAELDQVAGGKSKEGGMMIFVSFMSVGLICIGASVGANKIANDKGDTDACLKVFE